MEFAVIYAQYWQTPTTSAKIPRLSAFLFLRGENWYNIHILLK